MTDRPITPEQDYVLRGLRSWMFEKKYPPTYKELSNFLGFKSPNTTQEHLRQLEDKGAIEIDNNLSRAIRVLDDQCVYCRGEK